MPTRTRTRRRSRYTATFADGTRHVVLAYSVDGARAFYESAGHTVTHVVSGDHRRQVDALAAVREQGENGFRLDHAAIAKAKKQLGLHWPVDIRLTTREGGRYAAYSLKPMFGAFKRNPQYDTAHGGLRHDITVKAWLSPKNGGEALWHELCHAMQAERVAAELGDAATEREIFDAYKYHNDRYGIAYDEKPIEREARRYQKRNNSLPLAVSLNV